MEMNSLLTLQGDRKVQLTLGQFLCSPMFYLKDRDSAVLVSSYKEAG